jgi:hypothetical protein
LVNVGWIDKESQRRWNNWSKNGTKLPYQLWPKKPWRVSGSTSLFSRIFGGPPKPVEIRTSNIIPARDDFCHIHGLTMQSVKDWAAFRSGRSMLACTRRSEHQELNQRCELEPWTRIQNLQHEMKQQVQFLNAVIEVNNGTPDFQTGLEKAVADYYQFMLLFRKPRSQATGNFSKTMSRLGPLNLMVAGEGEINHVPPTLEIDIIWHTHRLFPGKYWRWSHTHVWRLVDQEATSHQDGVRLLAETRFALGRGSMKPSAEPDSVNRGFDRYMPSSAKPVVFETGRDRISRVIEGRNPTGRRRLIARLHGGCDGSHGGYSGYSGGGDGGGYSGGDSGGGGDGGGGGCGGG